MRLAEPLSGSQARGGSDERSDWLVILSERSESKDLHLKRARQPAGVKEEQSLRPLGCLVSAWIASYPAESPHLHGEANER
jgi:hypothetical protein